LVVIVDRDKNVGKVRKNPLNFPTSLGIERSKFSNALEEKRKGQPEA